MWTGDRTFSGLLITNFKLNSQKQNGGLNMAAAIIKNSLDLAEKRYPYVFEVADCESAIKIFQDKMALSIWRQESSKTRWI